MHGSCHLSLTCCKCVAKAVQVPSLLDRSEDLAQDLLSGSAYSTVTAHLYLRHSGSEPLTDVTLSLTGPPGLHLDQV